MLSMASEEWVNTIVASYIEPTQKWAEHGAPVRRETADIVADGKPREQRMMLGFVTWVKQAGRVDRKSTRRTPVTNAQLVCRLLLEKKNIDTLYRNLAKSDHASSTRLHHIDLLK